MKQTTPQQKGISAAAFGSQSFNSHSFDSKPQEQPKQPQTLIVDRWNGTKWIQIECAWDGESYKEVK